MISNCGPDRRSGFIETENLAFQAVPKAFEKTVAAPVSLRDANSWRDSITLVVICAGSVQSDGGNPVACSNYHENRRQKYNECLRDIKHMNPSDRLFLLARVLLIELQCKPPFVVASIDPGKP